MDLALNNLQRLIPHKTQPPNQPKQSDGEAPVMLGLWGMQRGILHSPKRSV